MIKDYIIKNNGITLNNKGGIVNYERGFVVSLPNYEFKTSNINICLKKLNEYLNIIKDKNLYAGVWLYKGIYYVDINIIVNTEKQALRIAKKHLQKAYFDLKKGESKDLYYNVKFYSLYELDKNKNDIKIVNQFNNLTEILNFFDNKYKINYINKAISTKQLINNKYYIFIDKINIQDL